MDTSKRFSNMTPEEQTRSKLYDSRLCSSQKSSAKRLLSYDMFISDLNKNQNNDNRMKATYSPDVWTKKTVPEPKSITREPTPPN